MQAFCDPGSALEAALLNEPKAGANNGLIWLLVAVNRIIKGELGTFFITKSGYLGFTSANVTRGDRLCIPFGCPAPLIVRPMRGWSKYQLLSSCYSHGLMEGEGIEKWQKGEYKVQKMWLV
jgi:hypothetical protein